ncbi:MAG: hypothetical protein FJW34_05270 [Acidobacteria bacterium]|nr:hypothetical protein [Acidobacteriota bacterium]
MKRPRAGWWRWIAGAAVLAVLIGFGVLLMPHYRRHRAFERALEGMMREPAGLAAPDEVLRARVVNRAAGLGLRVEDGQVRVRRTAAGVRLEVRYTVPVDVAVYTVDLHFRAATGR